MCCVDVNPLNPIRTLFAQVSPGIICDSPPLHDEKSISTVSVKQARYSSQLRMSMPVAYWITTSRIAFSSISFSSSLLMFPTFKKFSLV